MLFKAIYLLGAARVNEIVGKKSPKGKGSSEILGPKGTDVSLEEINQPNPELIQVIQVLKRIGKGEVNIEQTIDNFSEKIQVAVFERKIERQQSDNNGPPVYYVALPFPEKYEPWTKEVFDYFKRAGNNYVFPFLRQSANSYIRYHGTFKNLKYTINDYPVRKYTSFGKIKDEIIPSHPKKLTLEGLRHVRISELKIRFGFNRFDIAAYTGSFFPQSLKEEIEDFDISQDWRQYIGKLCREKSKP